MHWYEMKLDGRGHTSSALSQVCRPDRAADVPKYLEQVGKNGIIARGSGSSYADQAVNADGAVMMTGRLDCIRSFDEKTGELICEPGVTLKTITELYGPRGFMLATATRSGQHTLGGAIAANIVGQNGHKRTSLAKSVNWIDVVLANGETVRAGNSENADLFKAVIGGQDYADYLLSFVQCCISYPDPISSADGGYVLDTEEGSGDMFLHGEWERWSYPLETIHTGYGDCEDTAFLAASLFSAAGYGAAIATIPNHMVTAVVLADFTPHSAVTGLELAEKRVTSTGENLFFCETATDVAVPCGYVTKEVLDGIDALDSVTMVVP